MTDCTERHSAAPKSGLAGEGQKGMTKEQGSEQLLTALGESLATDV